MSYRTYQKSPSPELPLAQLTLDENPSDPELAKYLNRDYWESRKTTDSPASPSAPSPMAQPLDAIPLKVSNAFLSRIYWNVKWNANVEWEIDFSFLLHAQVFCVFSLRF